MTRPLQSPLMFVELLADRHKRLAGLHWTPGPGAVEDLEGWLASASFGHLASEVPCLWDEAAVAHWPLRLQQALSAASAQRVGGAAIVRADTAFPAALPLTSAWVSGPWYLQPPSRPSAAQAASRSLALRLVQLVAADADTRELEDVFRRDATLSYHLLRLVNSLAVGSSREITSFSQAILMLGRQQLRRWLNLMLFAARSDDDRSAMLMSHVALRARGMELLALELGLDRLGQEQAFMAGMFSMLGTLFGMSTEEVLKPVKLSAELNAALLRHEGQTGELLAAWEAAERADAASLMQRLAVWGIAPSLFNDRLVEAGVWMLDLTRGPAQ